MSDTTERDAVQQEFYAQAAATGLPYEYCHTLVVDSMTDEIVRLRAILAKLREPSEGVVIAGAVAARWAPLTTRFLEANEAIIRAAVVTAEQEVGHG